MAPFSQLEALVQRHGFDPDEVIILTDRYRTLPFSFHENFRGVEIIFKVAMPYSSVCVCVTEQKQGDLHV